MNDDVKEKKFPVTDPQGTDDEMFGKLQRQTFDYFLDQVSPVTALIADKTQPGFPSSIAVTGMGLTA
jgi:hypothetical protein